MTTDVVALVGQVEANRGNGRLSDYGFTTRPVSEKQYDFCTFSMVVIDMVCWTLDVETVVLLSDKKIDGHINIDLDVEKLEDKSVASK